MTHPVLRGTRACAPSRGAWAAGRGEWTTAVDTASSGRATGSASRHSASYATSPACTCTPPSWTGYLQRHGVDTELAHGGGGHTHILQFYFKLVNNLHPACHSGPLSNSGPPEFQSLNLGSGLIYGQLGKFRVIVFIPN